MIWVACLRKFSDDGRAKLGVELTRLNNLFLILLHLHIVSSLVPYDILVIVFSVQAPVVQSIKILRIECDSLDVELNLEVELLC